MIPKLSMQRSSIGLYADPHEFSAVQLVRDGEDVQVCAWAIFSRLESHEAATDSPIGLGDERELAWAMSILNRRGFHGNVLTCTPPVQTCTQHVFELPPADSGAPLEQLARVEVARERRCESNDFEIGFWELPKRGRSTETIAVACSKELVSGMINSAHDAELEVAGIDLPELAIVRGVKEHLQGVDESGARPIHAVLHVGWDHSIAIVTLSDRLVYVRRVPHGASSAWKNAVERYGMSEKGARAVIGDFELDEGAEQIEKIRVGCWTTLGKQLASELDVAFAYVSHSYRMAPLGKIVLVGYGANNSTLHGQIDELLGMPIVDGTPGDVAQAMPPEKVTQLGARLGYAYGLAARFDG
jgi:Tfp pilus assembly PilM family ATPase